MPYIKLIKLLYLADRQALIDTGLPITGDRMMSLDYGPVLSRTLDQITLGAPPEPSDSLPWFEYVTPPEDYNVSARKAPESDLLSEYEIEVLQAVYEQFGGMNRWALVQYTHTLPEWHDPGAFVSSGLIQLRFCGLLGSQKKRSRKPLSKAEEVWFIRKLA